MPKVDLTIWIDGDERTLADDVEMDPVPRLGESVQLTGRAFGGSACRRDARIVSGTSYFTVVDVVHAVTMIDLTRSGPRRLHHDRPKVVLTSVAELNDEVFDWRPLCECEVSVPSDVDGTCDDCGDMARPQSRAGS